MQRNYIVAAFPWWMLNFFLLVLQYWLLVFSHCYLQFFSIFWQIHLVLSVGDLNLIKDYKNEGNGGFQRLDNRHGRRAIEEGGHGRCQEVAEVSPKTVHSIKESDKKMKRGHLQRRTPAGVDDDLSLLAEKR
jgi:hypothetical protein